MKALVKAGADVIELGVPFSDPMADGPVIQRASERALAHGVGLATVLDTVRAFRQDDPTTAIVLMGYANPIEAMGVEVFADRAQDAGVDGVLVVDYPPEEAVEFAETAGSARHRSHFPARADDAGAAHCRGGEARPRLCLLCFAQGRDRARVISIPPRCVASSRRSGST
jgi:hypothetical protein